MKLSFQFIILFSLSIIFSNNHPIRCGLHEEILNPNRVRSTRPITDTYSVSPSGSFYIHYDFEGSDAPNQIDNNDNGIPD